jgi:hypothetical protein
LLIFNNTNATERKKLKIKIIENGEEETQRLKILKINKGKYNQLKSPEQKILGNKKMLNLLMKLIEEPFLTNEMLKMYGTQITTDLLNILMDRGIHTQCIACNDLCEIEDVFFCKYCENYKCFECVLYACTVCEDLNCDYANNLCKKTLFKCNECGRKLIDEFTKKNECEKITSQLLITNGVDILDFENKYCDKIFNCGICKEDVNLTPNKISKCDTCKEFCCKNCGFYTCSEIDTSYDDAKIIFTCANCEDNAKKNKKNKIKVQNVGDVIIVKARAFTKLEKDTLALSADEECTICYTNKKTFACIPCGHLCLCYKCKNSIEEKCPLCNEKIDSIVKIFS